MRKILSPRRQKAGLPPGTPVHIGEAEGTVRVTVYEYDEHQWSERTLNDPGDLEVPDRDSGVVWINVDGVHDIGIVTRVCERFGIHPLVQEDIVNTDQRPKAEEYDGYLYVVVKMIRQSADAETIDPEQISLIVMNRLVISFQQRTGDVFDSLRSRIRSGKGRVRREGADYLAYCILDAIVDHYFILLEGIEGRIEPLEEAVLVNPDPKAMVTIQALKRDLLFLRRSLWPMREMIYRLSREGAAVVREDTRPFLRDLYDHVIHLIEILEAFQEIVAGTMDIYLSSVSNRMNNIMKVLTIIATIFIPLTFVAGVYGMNFAFMPELEWRWSYPAILALMALVAALMLRFFRRKGWI